MLAVDVGPYTGLGTRDDGLALLRDLKITFPAGTVFNEDILTAIRSSACRPPFSLLRTA